MSARLKGWPRTLWHGYLDVAQRLASRRRSTDVSHQDSATRVRGWPRPNVAESKHAASANRFTEAGSPTPSSRSGNMVRGWMVPLLLGGVAAYAIAEEITLTTYYPSPRGVYNELRTAGNVQIGLLDPPAVGLPGPPRLHLVQGAGASGDVVPAALRVDDEAPVNFTLDATPFLIDAAGNVGIGTASPVSKLAVAGRVDIGSPSPGFPFSPVLVIHQGTPNLAGFGMTNGGTGWALISVVNLGAGGFNPVSQAGDTGLIFSTGVKETGNLVIGPWSDTAKGIRITSTGSVGIGTSPTSRLTVEHNAGEAIWGATLTGTGIRATALSGTALTAVATTGKAITAAVTTPAPATAVWASAPGGGNAGLFQGRVRVEPIAGVTEPILDVTGNIFATGTVHGDSDARLKTNVMPLMDVLTKLEQMRGVSFEWNALANSRGHALGERGVGVIGQELEAVFPELVSALGPEQYRAVDYGKLSAVLLEALKELKHRHESLERDHEALAHDHEALQQAHETLAQRVEELERRLIKLTTPRPTTAQEK